ncbi:MAG: toll/interleukin-1 receptor domain-containing protein [Anaerolineae bacterium]|nr:toll/interleukin-1 receptor domain-containing protein [Anaerolineae bacterium]
MRDAFISYKRSTSGILAYLIKNVLEKEHGLNVFLDVRNLTSGPWLTQLRQEINQSRSVVCILSNTTLSSSVVKEEIRSAQGAGKTLIPVFHEQCKPSQISTKFNDQLTSFLLDNQGVQLLDKRLLFIEEGISQLASLIKSADTFQAKSSNEKIERIEVAIDDSFKSLDDFRVLIAGISLVGVNSVNVIAQSEAKKSITVEMPEEAAQRLLTLTQNQSTTLGEFNLVDARKLEVSEVENTIIMNYSRQDRAAVEYVRDVLQREGINVWVDTMLPSGTANWISEISNQIKRSSGMIAFLSPNSNNSQGFLNELAYAQAFYKRIFPVWIRGDNYTDSVPLSLFTSQAFDLREIRGGYNAPDLTHLVEAIKRHIENQ